MDWITTLAMNPTIDKNVSIDRVVPEHKLRCSKPSLDPGGGVNVARAIRKLGGKATLFYTAGGIYGTLRERLLEEEGLDHLPLRVEEQTRESFTVDESSSGQQYRFSTPGPELTAEEWHECLKRVTSAAKPGYLVVSGSIPPGVPDDFYARLARLAKERDAKLFLDASGIPFRLGVGEGVFLIKPNLREFRRLCGDELEDEAGLVAAAERLIAAGDSEIVVVSLAASGALMVWRGGHERLRAPTVSIHSKVGAGDSMVAGIVKAMADGAAPVAAVRYGVAAGAAAVMTPGTQLCRLEDTRNLYNQIAEEARH